MLSYRSRGGMRFGVRCPDPSYEYSREILPVWLVITNAAAFLPKFHTSGCFLFGSQHHTDTNICDHCTISIIFNWFCRMKMFFKCSFCINRPGCLTVKPAASGPLINITSLLSHCLFNESHQSQAKRAKQGRRLTKTDSQTQNKLLSHPPALYFVF